MVTSRFALLLLALLVPGLAFSQDAAPPEEETVEEAKPEVRLVAEVGFVALFGNTRAINLNGGIGFGVKHQRNAFSLDIGANYGRGVAADEWIETALKFGGAARYDRFLTDVNSIYVKGGLAHDPFAGLLLRGRGDVGYSHLLVNTDQHNLVAEAGFNYTRDQFGTRVDEEYVTGTDPVGQHFVGARLYAAYGLNLGVFGFTQSVEALLGGTDNADQTFDGSLVSNTGITATLSKVFSIRLGGLVSWDFEPPINPATGEAFKAVDVTTSATLVATLM